MFHRSDVCVTDPSGGGERGVKKIYCHIAVTMLLMASNSTPCCPVPWRSDVGLGRESSARGSVWLKPRAAGLCSPESQAPLNSHGGGVSTAIGPRSPFLVGSHSGLPSALAVSCLPARPPTPSPSESQQHRMALCQIPITRPLSREKSFLRARLITSALQDLLPFLDAVDLHLSYTSHALHSRPTSLRE